MVCISSAGYDSNHESNRIWIFARFVSKLRVRVMRIHKRFRSEVIVSNLVLIMQILCNWTELLAEAGEWGYRQHQLWADLAKKHLSRCQRQVHFGLLVFSSMSIYKNSTIIRIELDSDQSHIQKCWRFAFDSDSGFAFEDSTQREWRRIHLCTFVSLVVWARLCLSVRLSVCTYVCKRERIFLNWISRPLFLLLANSNLLLFQFAFCKNTKAGEKYAWAMSIFFLVNKNQPWTSL